VREGKWRGNQINCSGSRGLQKGETVAAVEGPPIPLSPGPPYPTPVPPSLSVCLGNENRSNTNTTAKVANDYDHHCVHEEDIAGWWRSPPTLERNFNKANKNKKTTDKQQNQTEMMGMELMLMRTIRLHNAIHLNAFVVLWHQSVSDTLGCNIVVALSRL